MSDFQHLKRETLSDTVYQQLRDAILAGDIAAGQDLNQVTLAKQFDVSRVPVREALRRLQAEQLVTATPYQQYVVAAVAPAALLELVDVRETLEVFAVSRAVGRVAPEVLAEARVKNESLRTIDDGALWLAGDVELHILLAGPGSETARLVQEIRGRIHRYLRTIASTPSRRRQACDEHENIIAAIEAGDVEAASEAMREHIGHTREVIREWLAAHDDGAPRAAVAE